MKKLLAVVAAVACATAAFATDYTWTGGANDGGKWSSPANWNVGTGYPSAYDDLAVFDGGDPVTVTLDVEGVTQVQRITAKNGAKVTVAAVANAIFDIGGNTGSSGQLRVESDSELVLKAPCVNERRCDIVNDRGFFRLQSVVTNKCDQTCYWCVTGTNYLERGSQWLGKGYSLYVGAGIATTDPNRWGRIILSDDAKLRVSLLYMGVNAEDCNQELVVDGDEAEVEVLVRSSLGDEAPKDADGYRERESVVTVNRGSFMVRGGDLSLGINRRNRLVQNGGYVYVNGNFNLQANGRFAGGGAYFHGGLFELTGVGLGKAADSTEWFVDGGTNRFLRTTDAGASSGIVFGGDARVECPGANTIIRFPRMRFLPEAKLTVAGPGGIGCQCDLDLADVELDLVEGGDFYHELASYNGGYALQATEEATKPWKLKIGDGSMFRIYGADASIVYPPDLTVEGTGYIQCNGRCTVYFNSVTLPTGALPVGRTASAPNTWFRGSSPSAAIIPTKWTGKGDGKTWSEAANWEGAVVPSGTTATADLTAASEVEITADTEVGTIFFGPKKGGQTLTVKNAEGGDFWLRSGFDSYLDAVRIRRDATIVFDCKYSPNNVARALQGGTFVSKRGWRKIWTSQHNPIGGTLKFAGAVTLDGSGLDLQYTGSGGNQSMGYVVYGDGAVITARDHGLMPSGYSRISRITQEAGSSVKLTGDMWMTKFATSATDCYVMEGGTLTIANRLRLGEHMRDNSTLTRHPGGDFTMFGGDVTAKGYSSEQNSNYFYLYGGTVNVGADGFVATCTTEKRNYTPNTKPTLQLGGVTIKATADFASDLPAELLGITTIDTDGHDVTFNSTVEGVGRLVKTGAGALVLGGAGTFDGSLEVAAGTVRFSAGLDDGAEMARLDLADGATLTVDKNVTVAVRELVVNGVRQAAGTYDFGDGQVEVSAGGNIWIGASGGAWFTSGNWSGGTPVSGIGESVDFSLSPLGANDTVVLDHDVTLASLVCGGAEGLTLTLSGEGTKLVSDTNAVITVRTGTTLILDVDFQMGYDQNLTNVLTVAGGGKLVFRKNAHNTIDSTNINVHWTMYVVDGTEVVFEGDQKGFGVYAVTTSNLATAPRARVVLRDGGAMQTAGTFVTSQNSAPWSNYAGEFTMEGGYFAMGGTPSVAAADYLQEYFALKGGEIDFAGGYLSIKTASAVGNFHWTISGGAVAMGAGCIFSRGLTDVTLAGDLTLMPYGGRTRVTTPFKGEGTVTVDSKDGAGEAFFDGKGTAAITAYALKSGVLGFNDEAAASVPATVTLDVMKGTALDLDYEGEIVVDRLYLNGRERKAGVYGGATGLTIRGVTIGGTGTLRVLNGNPPGSLILVR